MDNFIQVIGTDKVISKPITQYTGGAGKIIATNEDGVIDAGLLVLAEGSSEVVKTYVATFPISGHRAVAQDYNGELEYADKDSGNLINTIGITLNSALEGDLVVVKVKGNITEPSWNWDNTKSIFVGNNGVLTQEEILTGEVLKIARPLSTTQISVEERQLIIQLEE